MSEKKRFSRPMRADEMLAQLELDPNYVRSMKEREEQTARNRVEFQQLERPVLEELHEVGIAVPSVGNAAFFNDYVPLSRPAVDVLLRWVPITHPRVQECLVRLLATAGAPFDGRVLAQLFDRTESSELRWVIANTLEMARPSGIGEWLERQLLSHSVGDATRPLFKALNRVCDRDTVLDVARDLLELLPDAVAPVLGKYGTEHDIAALQRMVNREEPSTQRKLKSAIEKIERRGGGSGQQ